MSPETAMSDNDQDSTPSEGDFHCGCCYELMVDPTTLNCGHSFCRICLARWWSSSRNTTCPECRQAWIGFPNINIILRKTIQKLFPDKLAERTECVESEPDYRKALNKFEAFGKKRLSQKQSGNLPIQPQGRWMGITKAIVILTAVFGILLFFYDLFGIIFSWNQPALVHKPIEAWSPTDVSNWVATLGSWSKEIDPHKFQELGINGNILKSMTDSGLEDLLHIRKPYLRKSLLSEIEHVKHLGYKAPTELWEYKALYPTRCMFLLWGFREYPRATIIYTFIFLHKEVFLPLFLATTDGNVGINLSEFDNEWYPPASDILRFLVRVMLTPYYIIGKFAFQWVHVNMWSVGMMITVCTLKTLSELLQSRWLFMGGWKNLPSIVVESTKSVIANGSFYFLLWNVLPAFISDMIFYYLMITAPLYAWNSLSESFHNTRIDVGPVENTPLELTKSIVLWVWHKITRRLQNNPTAT